jgi:hypothetical protein
MNLAELSEYPLHENLLRGQSALLLDLEPVFIKLRTSLLALCHDSNMPDILLPFEVAIEEINKFSDEIETVEREAILEIIYDVGELAGLDSASQFAEEWRGDW